MPIRIKTADPNTTVTLPESVTVGGPGTTSTLQIKNSAGDLVPIKQLFTKIDSVTQGSGSPQTIKIWPFPPTIDPTQPGTNDEGDGGEGQCGACTVGNEVWYPIQYNTSDQQYRWDCGVWNATGKVNIQFNTGIIPPPGPNNTSYYYVYDLVSGQNVAPPPPGYILADYTTYAVPDWIFVYCSRPTIQSNNWTLPSATNLKFYKFNYIDDVGNPITPSNDCIQTCGSPCYSTPCVGSSGFGGGFCPSIGCDGEPIPINNFVTQTDPLFNSLCTSTSSGCLNYCYTNPEPNSFYHCRNVQNILSSVNYNSPTESILDPDGCGPKFAVFYAGESYSSQYQGQSGLYSGPIKYNDIGLLNEAACGGSSSSSAWHMRIFLPFYVSLPDTYVGKYIKFKEIPSAPAEYPNWEDFLDSIGDDESGLTDVLFVLKRAYEIIAGRIFAAGFVYGKHDDTNSIYWGAVGFPKELTHTHVLLLEVNNPSANQCDVCIKGSDFGSPKYFGFYPITKPDKTFTNYLSDYMKRSIVLSDGTKCGLNNLKQITEKDTTESSNCFAYSGVGYYYKDELVSGTLQNTSNESKFNGSLTTSQKNQLTLKRFIDTYSNPNKITITQDTDCGCTQGIAALTAGSGMEITPVVDGFPNSITLSITDTITDDLETSVVLVESIIDTVTSTASEGADGGTW